MNRTDKQRLMRLKDMNNSLVVTREWSEGQGIVATQAVQTETGQSGF